MQDLEIPEGLTEEEEQELLDAIAPRGEEVTLTSFEELAEHSERVQGCASCGYDPDFCGPGCGKYDYLRQEGLA